MVGRSDTHTHTHYHVHEQPCWSLSHTPEWWPLCWGHQRTWWGAAPSRPWAQHGPGGHSRQTPSCTPASWSPGPTVNTIKHHRHHKHCHIFFCCKKSVQSQIPDRPTPKYFCQFSKQPVFVFSDFWPDFGGGGGGGGEREAADAPPIKTNKRSKDNFSIIHLAKTV